MKTIYKYSIESMGTKIINLPVGSKLRKLGVQNNELFAWIELDLDENVMEDRYFTYFGTGHSIPNSPALVFIDTIFANPFVWHVYEVQE